MFSMFNWRIYITALLSVMLLAACGSGGGSNGGDPDVALRAEIEQLFPFTPNQPIEVIFQCARQGSVLVYFLDLKNDGTFDITITTDTGLDVFQAGTYTYLNNEIHLMTGSPAGAIIFNLDERSTAITPAFGLVAGFQTANMICAAIGHRYNDPAIEPATTVHYDCPNINFQTLSFDNSAIEFVLRTIPFNLAVPGSAFRARDRFITPSPQAFVLRGYGLYRRLGNDYYIVFAPGTFDDYNILSGVVNNGGLQISVNQLEPERGDCNLQ